MTEEKQNLENKTDNDQVVVTLTATKSGHIKYDIDPEIAEEGYLNGAAGFLVGVYFKAMNNPDFIDAILDELIVKHADGSYEGDIIETKKLN